MLLKPQAGIGQLFALLALFSFLPPGIGQTDILSSQAVGPQKVVASPLAKNEKEETPPPSYPQLADITALTGIQFEHVSSSDQEFIVESMSGGVALIDYVKAAY